MTEDLTGCSKQGSPGFGCLLVCTSVKGLEVVRTVEMNQRNLGERDVLPVGKSANDVSGIRITSYNVCYTKLLRAAVFFCALKIYG